jgi:Spy/CpxP family protein refolding chaperone
MKHGLMTTMFDFWGRHMPRVIAAALLASVVPSAATAQVTPPAGERRGGRPDDPRRGELERRFQQRVDAMVRQRLQLTDEQATKLREVASRAETTRRALRREEMQARQAMRDELLAGDHANESKVADLMEQMPRLERRRIELMEQEQRELSKFLSPIQRARYFALQDELRRNMQELQRRRMGTVDSSQVSGRAGVDGRQRRRPPGIDR